MDRFHEVTKKRIWNDNLRTLITLAVAFVLVLVSMLGTYKVLLINSRKMGHELIQSYASDEERSIAVYNTIIKMGISSMESSEESGSPEEISIKMQDFFKKAADASGDPDLQCFAIIKGRLVSTEPIEGLDKYDFENTGWYRNVLAADGQVIFTDINEESGAKLTVAAAGEPDTDCAVFINLRKQDFISEHSGLNLPEKGAYYLFDTDGHLLYYTAPFEVDEASLEEYAMGLCADIHNGKISNEGDDIIDLNGEVRGIYYNQVNNGWLCIMTIPHSVLLTGFNNIIIIYVSVFAVFMLIIIFMFVHDIHMGQTIIHTGAIIRALCNTYYAIYRIDLKKGTYDMIKGSDEMQKLIPRKGEFNAMMDGFASVVDEDTAAEMRSSFSLEHLRELASKQIRDFGGDFLRRLNGDDKWVNMAFILDESLTKEEGILVFRQIDTEKQQQIRHTKLLESALASADASEKSQKYFFSKMSHEMRTPLNIILGMNELAMSPDCPENKRLDYLKKIEYSGKDMLGLINNILEISRIEDGLMPIDRKVINLREEFTNIVQPFREQAVAQGKRCEIKIDISKNMVMGDVLKLSQIMNNLLSNAVRFTRSEDSITVAMRQAAPDSSNYIFTVEDTGIGMSEAFLPKLFTPYSQENRFGNRSETGGGLGMAIVKSLVTQKGGQIDVSSTAGKGTKVVVTLPFAPVPTEETAVQTNDGCLKNLNMLVVDDNELNRELMSDLLTEHGVKVTPACDGKEALEIFKCSELFSCDVIIMDMQMPVMDGCASAAAIRALDRPDANWVIIIALTANSFSEDVIRTVKAGMNAHLAKPADMKVLQETIKKLLSERSGGIMQ